MEDRGRADVYAVLRIPMYGFVAVGVLLTRGGMKSSFRNVRAGLM